MKLMDGCLLVSPLYPSAQPLAVYGNSLSFLLPYSNGFTVQFKWQNRKNENFGKQKKKKKTENRGNKLYISPIMDGHRNTKSNGNVGRND